jgi:hypothetical protein
MAKVKERDRREWVSDKFGGGIGLQAGGMIGGKIAGENGQAIGGDIGGVVGVQ